MTSTWGNKRRNTQFSKVWSLAFPFVWNRITISLSMHASQNNEDVGQENLPGFMNAQYVLNGMNTIHIQMDKAAIPKVNNAISH